MTDTTVTAITTDRLSAGTCGGGEQTNDPMDPATAFQLHIPPPSHATGLEQQVLQISLPTSSQLSGNLVVFSQDQSRPMGIPQAQLVTQFNMKDLPETETLHELSTASATGGVMNETSHPETDQQNNKVVYIALQTLNTPPSNSSMAPISSLTANKTILSNNNELSLHEVGSIPSQREGVEMLSVSQTMLSTNINENQLTQRVCAQGHTQPDVGHEVEKGSPLLGISPQSGEILDECTGEFIKMDSDLPTPEFQTGYCTTDKINEACNSGKPGFGQSRVPQQRAAGKRRRKCEDTEKMESDGEFDDYKYLMNISIEENYNCRSCSFSCKDKMAIVNHLKQKHKILQGSSSSDNHSPTQSTANLKNRRPTKKWQVIRVKNRNLGKQTKTTDALRTLPKIVMTNQDSTEKSDVLPGVVQESRSVARIQAGNVVMDTETDDVRRVAMSESDRIEVIDETRGDHRGPDNSKPQKTDDGNTKTTTFIVSKSVRSGVIRPYKCTLCPSRFRTIEQMKDHVVYHAEPSGFRCLKCKYTCKRWSSLKEHLFRHGGKKPFRCSQCDYHSVYRKDVLRHLSRHTTDRPFICEKCGQSFKRESHLRAHTETHDKKKLFSFNCDVCGKVFISKRALYTHLREHKKAPQRMMKYVCPICSRQYSMMKRLTQHIKTHSSLKPYMCDKCGKSFKKKYTFMVHLETHVSKMDDNMFYCDTCDFKSPSRKETFKHSQQHVEDPRPLKCPYCRYTCGDSDYYAAHLAKHTGEKPFECEHCGFQTATKRSLIHHVKLKHPDNYKPPPSRPSRNERFEEIIRENTEMQAAMQEEKRLEIVQRQQLINSHLTHRVHQMVINKSNVVSSPAAIMITGTQQSSGIDDSISKLDEQQAALQLLLNMSNNVSTGDGGVDIRQTPSDATTDSTNVSIAYTTPEGRCIYVEPSLLMNIANTNTDHVNIAPDPTNINMLTSQQSALLSTTCDEMNFIEQTPMMLPNDALTTTQTQQQQQLPMLQFQQTSPPYYQTPITTEMSMLYAKKYKCKICLTWFSDRSELEVHRRCHCQDEFKCLHCEYKAAHWVMVQQHMKSHAHLKPHKCTHCSFATRNKKDLRRHILTHTNEKPYPCPACAQRFKRQSHVQHHFSRNHSETSRKKRSVQKQRLDAIIAAVALEAATAGESDVSLHFEQNPGFQTQLLQAASVLQQNSAGLQQQLDNAHSQQNHAVTQTTLLNANNLLAVTQGQLLQQNIQNCTVMQQLCSQAQQPTTIDTNDLQQQGIIQAQTTLPPNVTFEILMQQQAQLQQHQANLELGSSNMTNSVLDVSEQQMPIVVTSQNLFDHQQNSIHETVCDMSVVTDIPSTAETMTINQSRPLTNTGPNNSQDHVISDPVVGGGLVDSVSASGELTSYHHPYNLPTTGPVTGMTDLNSPVITTQAPQFTGQPYYQQTN